MDIRETLPNRYRECSGCLNAQKVLGDAKSEAKSRFQTWAELVDIKVSCDPDIDLSKVTAGVCDSPFSIPIYSMTGVHALNNPSCPQFHSPPVEGVICPGKEAEAVETSKSR